MKMNDPGSNAVIKGFAIAACIALAPLSVADAKADEAARRSNALAFENGGVVNAGVKTGHWAAQKSATLAI